MVRRMGGGDGAFLLVPESSGIETLIYFKYLKIEGEDTLQDFQIQRVSCEVQKFECSTCCWEDLKNRTFFDEKSTKNHIKSYFMLLNVILCDYIQKITFLDHF